MKIRRDTISEAKRAVYPAHKIPSRIKFRVGVAARKIQRIQAVSSVLRAISRRPHAQPDVNVSRTNELRAAR